MVPIYNSILSGIKNLLRKPRTASEWPSVYKIALQYVEMANALMNHVKDIKGGLKDSQLLCAYILGTLMDKSIVSQIPLEVHHGVAFSLEYLPADKTEIVKPMSWNLSLAQVFDCSVLLFRGEPNRMLGYINDYFDVLLLTTDSLDRARTTWDVAMALFVDLMYRGYNIEFNHQVSMIILKKFIQRLMALDADGISADLFTSFENIRMGIYTQLYQLIGLKPDKAAAMNMAELYIPLAVKSLGIRSRQHPKHEWPICRVLTGVSSCPLATLNEISFLLTSPDFQMDLNKLDRLRRDTILADFNRKVLEYSHLKGEKNSGSQ